MDEMSWHRVIKAARLRRESRHLWVPPGKAADAAVLLLVSGDSVYAVSAQCPHQGFSLERGAVDSKALTLQCPLHHWDFSLESGAGVSQGGCLQTYLTRLEDGWVWVKSMLK